MSPGQLAHVDIAEMNLLCATGLPGAASLDIDRCLAKLDEWAQKVDYETKRHLYRAHDPRYAEHYKYSENWLRAEFLAQVLHEDCGVHYNVQRVRNIDFRRSQDLFIHGMIDDANGGTCASMPVLYVAVGRRLGYPLKLVLTKAHVFARWDDGDERFNIETTGQGGTERHSDEYYKNWPLEWTPQEKTRNRYLISLSPAGELASFLANRGHCLLDNGRTTEALNAYTAACRLAPEDPTYLAWAGQARRRLRPAAFARRHPRRFREYSTGHRLDPLAELERINAINRANMERVGLPPRPGGPGQARSPRPHPGLRHPQDRNLPGRQQGP
jgi:tetratricopeptide (TPR) repeat protein